MKVSHIWEYLPDEDKLLEHHYFIGGLTFCGKKTWSADTDKAVDPDGIVWEDTWFIDHERPNDDVIECRECLD